MSLKTIQNKGFYELLEREEPDVILLQEIKIKEITLINEVIKKLFNYRYYEFNIGTFGTCFFSKIKPLSWKIYNPFDQGRVISIYFPDITLINVYAPNAGTGLKFMDRKLEWNKFLNSLIIGNVLICGDFNVVNNNDDIWINGDKTKEKSYSKLAGYTTTERDDFKTMLKNNDMYVFEPEKGESKYTYYSIKTGSNKKFFNDEDNKGWRLDYFITNKKGIIDSCKLRHIKHSGSDHLPILLEYKKNETFNQIFTSVKYTELKNTRIFRQTISGSKERPLYKMFEYADYMRHKIYISYQNSLKSYQFVSFASIDDFEDWYKNVNKTCYEIIRECNRCKVYFDLDNLNIDSAIKEIKKIYNTTDLLIKKSQRGYHIICNDIWVQHNKMIKPLNVEGIDKKVYTNNRLMRLLYSSKFNKDDIFMPYYLDKKNYEKPKASDYFISMN